MFFLCTVGQSPVLLVQHHSWRKTRGCLSPILFAIYMDVLIGNLKRSDYGIMGVACLVNFMDASSMLMTLCCCHIP